MDLKIEKINKTHFAKTYSSPNFLNQKPKTFYQTTLRKVW